MLRYTLMAIGILAAVGLILVVTGGVVFGWDWTIEGILVLTFPFSAVAFLAITLVMGALSLAPGTMISPSVPNR